MISPPFLSFFSALDMKFIEDKTFGLEFIKAKFLLYRYLNYLLAFSNIKTPL